MRIPRRHLENNNNFHTKNLSLQISANFSKINARTITHAYLPLTGAAAVVAGTAPNIPAEAAAGAERNILKIILRSMKQNLKIVENNFTTGVHV